MKTHGLIAAPPTGFTQQGDLDLEVIAPLAAHLQAQGVAGVFVNGTTGEGASLTCEEREAAVQRWRQVLPPSMRLFVHVGHNSLADACRLARHAAAQGVDAIATIAPSFFKPANAAALVDWCAPVAAAAPQTPFYYYHMPAFSGVTVEVPAFLRQACDRIPNLAGVKFTHEALAAYQTALNQDDGRFDMLWGRDEMLLGALATGAVGAVGSTYNVWAPLYRRLIAAWESGDLAQARAAQARACTLINGLVATGSFFAGLKALLRAQGVPITDLVRAPLATMTDPGRVNHLIEEGNQP